MTKVKAMGGDRTEYVWNGVASSVDKVLDIGCGYGWTLAGLTGKAKELWGIDSDERSLRKAHEDYPHLKLVHQTATTLPFESDIFDVVILSEVIEHVGDQNKRQILDEACRVLKSGGLLLLTAPYAGVFAWADPMDFKRRFPGVYRAYMRISGYTPATPIEIGHKHVSLEEMNKLFRGRFRIEDTRYCGLLMPLLSWILAAGSRLRILPRRIEDLLNRFRGWESGVAYGPRLSFNIRLAARKR